jgi:nucleotide-binding universal stress UspA family protein
MYKKILVPIDGSRTSARGLLEGIRLARHCGASLRIFNVVEEYSVIRAMGVGGVAFDTQYLIDILVQDGKVALQKALALAKKHGVKADAISVETFADRSADFIVAEAKRWRADLIVMGTHGRRGVSRMLLGSDAEIVVRTSPVPVLLVRSPEPKALPKKKRA